MKIKVLANQTLIDMAMQGCGQVESWLDVANLNGVGATDEILPGQIIATPDAPLTLTAIVRMFGNKNLAPASGDSGTVQKRGIGYMQIGKDFKVS